MIGSKSKISKMWKRLEAKGIAQVYLDRVHAPIGLNIGADSPEEICISIMAEIIRERRLGKVQYTQRSAAMTGAARRLPCPVKGRGEARGPRATRLPAA